MIKILILTLILFQFGLSFSIATPATDLDAELSNIR